MWHPRIRRRREAAARASVGACGLVEADPVNGAGGGGTWRRGRGGPAGRCFCEGCRRWRRPATEEQCAAAKTSGAEAETNSGEAMAASCDAPARWREDPAMLRDAPAWAEPADERRGGSGRLGPMRPAAGSRWAPAGPCPVDGAERTCGSP